MRERRVFSFVNSTKLTLIDILTYTTTFFIMYHLGIRKHFIYFFMFRWHIFLTIEKNIVRLYVCTWRLNLKH